MKKIHMQKQGNVIVIGDAPQLVVDLNSQKNYIKYKDKTIPYARRVELSADLLNGKRANVLNTAVNYHYRQACEVVKGMQAAGNYRKKINTTVREVPRGAVKRGKTEG